MTSRTLRRVCFIILAQWALVGPPHVGTASGRVLASEIDGAPGVLLVCAMPSAAGKDGPMAKISPTLRALYEAYREAQRAGIPFTTTDPLVPIVGDRVVIDASASGDVGALQTDLVALGMTGAVSVGRIVSGQLPISALGSLATLPTLQFAWPAAAQTNRGRAGSNDQP